MAKLYISKLDVVKRELESAIILFFNNGDVVSTHLLASAAHRLLEEFCNKQGIKSERQAWIESGIKKERIKEFQTVLDSAYNFFKHADKDSEKVLTFNPKATEFTLFFCCKTYQRLTSEIPPLLAVFISWFFCSEPKLLSDPKAKELANQIKSSYTNKLKFFQEAYPATVRSLFLNNQ